jgi:segregation and condensation protein B
MFLNSVLVSQPMETSVNLTRESIDELDTARTGEHLRKLEAALFVSGAFMSIKDLVLLTELNPLLLRDLLVQLEQRYRGSGIQIVQKGDSWKMDVHADYTYMVNRLATGTTEFTKAEQETLAIIAFKQPMKQSVLIKIRGNKAYDHINRFVEMGLVVKKKQGHTAELSLHDSFYDYFNVSSSEPFLVGSSGTEA